MGFLREVERHFKDEPQGRYMAHILKECAIFEPEIVATIFPKLSKKCREALDRRHFQLRDDWGFPGFHKNKRYPDLTLIINSRIEGICEIKAEDANAPGNAEQLDDYRRYIRDHPYCSFTRLSKHGAFPRLPKKLAANPRTSELRFAQLHSMLRGDQSSNKPLTRMLTEYLEDRDMVGYRDLEESELRALQLLIIRALPLPHNHGLGKTLAWTNMMLVPEVMKKLLGNTAALGELLQQNSAAWSVDSNYFNVWPWLKAERALKSLKKELAKGKQERDELPALKEKDVAGGNVVFAFRLSSGAEKTSRRYLEGGYSFEVDLTASKPKRLLGYMYFSVWTNHPYRWVEGSSYGYLLENLPDQVGAMKLLKEAWHDLEQNMKSENFKLPKQATLRDAFSA